MFHKFDVLTDTKGNSLVGYQVGVRVTGGGGVVPIYADENGTPIQSVSGLANAALTDNAGNYSFFVALGTYDLEFRAPDGTVLATIRQVPMNGGSEGPAGPALATFDTLADFKAASSTNLTQILIDPSIASGMFNFETANAPYAADDLNIVKADDAPLSVGAWVRQKAEGVSAQAAGAGAVTRTVQEELRETIKVSQFATPQQAADKAGLNGGVLYLPPGDFTGNLNDTNDLVMEGPGRLFDSSGVLRSTYAEPRSRLIIGQEYLWAFHQGVAYNAIGENIPIVLTGDSTTYGSFNGGTLDDRDRLHTLLDMQLNRYGLYGPVITNSGVNGMQAREWVVPTTGRLDLDIAAYPTMAMYIIRLGLNDGSIGFHDIADYRTSIYTGLARLRAWKNVGNLSIVLMTPNSTSETGYRDEAWNEKVARILKNAAREFQCTFVDTYAIWRDARSGVNRWLDDDGNSASGIHPDGVHNRWIADALGEVLFRPLSVRGIATNTRINAAALGTRISAEVPATSFNYGDSAYRTDAPLTFPLDGWVYTFKHANGFTTQENTGYAETAEGPGKRTYTRFGKEGFAWSFWRDLDYNPPLVSPWAISLTDGRYVSYRKTVGGTVFVEGRVRNASAPSAGATITTLPPGARPATNMLFHAGAFVTEIRTDGTVRYVSGTATDFVLNCVFQAVD